MLPKAFEREVKLTSRTLDIYPAWLSRRRSGREMLGTLAVFRVAAVVKVTPLMGCVKYKAQHVVLAVRIPLFTRGECVNLVKTLVFAVDFAKSAR